ncbi:MAG: 16S rRNA (guanine(966)-N(2))-methyltransferase RsmD [Candidatus Delongbacteria bacterium]|nr:16S rRNA (guanine(966)-N(2))-methyltransferase RsmD [Candidatus Delongbacteria bacterium]
MINITGGNLKGRIIRSLKAEGLRPTTSFFREWIFNVLNNITDIEDSVVLDLYSGTGAVSFEFISRGAVSALLIEKSRTLTDLTKKNIETLKTSNVTVICSDSADFLRKLFSKGHKIPYNVIFMDPPYEKPELIDESLSLITSNSDLLQDETCIIVESSKDKVLNFGDSLVIFKEKLSGATKMSILRSGLC